MSIKSMRLKVGKCIVRVLLNGKMLWTITLSHFLLLTTAT